MKPKTMLISDIKNLRLERHWSQEQLAEMSGLSVRTIQRIEKGGNAGLESVKALASVFEVNLSANTQTNPNSLSEVDTSYTDSLKGLYKFIALAVFSLILPLVLSINDSSFWPVFLWMLLGWVVLILVYALNAFNLFGKIGSKKESANPMD
ncbi:MAG: hypothetical protein BM564_01320 [Bacteroidetes bacterium MedPE-SWsnd-G2]|nr:MAG: hypothetical protein BM564_01320 [Bacteroidetes bacterium MedPE-SWsnd-G2]